MLIQTGRKFYGICLTGLGIQQFVYSGFLPVILPAWPSWIPGQVWWAYLVGVALIGAGLAIIFERKGRAVALASGGVFLILLLFWHVPHLIFINPYSQHLGTWTQAFKMLALAGGGFAVAGSYESDAWRAGNQFSLMRLLDQLIPLGSVFFSITLIVFGIDHFLYVEPVAGLVPAWIPEKILWTYFAAGALIGSGLGIILKIKLKLVGMLTGTMIFLWFIVLHIPRAIADPSGNMGNEVTSTFQALGFSGIAFVIAYGVRRKSEPGN